MLTLRRHADRGRTRLGWLDSRHTFSFADYFDPRYMGIGDLRVINEDRVQPAAGFATHGHRDMEIISYVLDGALAHKDSLGNGSIIRPGDVQRMSAGTGVRHSEYNDSGAEPVHFLQIWILPNATGLMPGYEQTHFDDADLRGRLRLVVSHDGRDGSVRLHQDAALYAARIDAGAEVQHPLADNRKAYVQVARGDIVLNRQRLSAGDGAAIAFESRIQIGADTSAEVLLFDLR